MEKKMTTAEQDEVSLIEQAAEKRFPYAENNSIFNTMQNSSRGNFLDGAMWTLEQSKMLFPRCYDMIIRFYENYEPEETDDDKEMFAGMCEIFKLANEVNIGIKPRLYPTYPFSNLDKIISDLSNEVAVLRTELINKTEISI